MIFHLSKLIAYFLKYIQFSLKMIYNFFFKLMDKEINTKEKRKRQNTHIHIRKNEMDKRSADNNL